MEPEPEVRSLELVSVTIDGQEQDFSAEAAPFVMAVEESGSFSGSAGVTLVSFVDDSGSYSIRRTERFHEIDRAATR